MDITKTDMDNMDNMDLLPASNTSIDSIQVDNYQDAL